MMNFQRQRLADFAIEIDGDPSPPELHDDIRQILVETSIHAPSLFELHIFCTQEREVFRWIDDEASVKPFLIGMRISIAAQPVPIEGKDDSGAVPITLMHGVVTTLEPRFTENGDAILIVRGYDATHALHRGRKTTTFRNMTDSEIVTKVARDAGLDVDAKSTQTVHEHVLQYNQTDMAFLQSRARRVGFELYIDTEEVLHFAPLTSDLARGDVELYWGEALRQFQTCVGSGRQASNAVVRGWDSNTRQMIEAVIDLPSTPGNGGPALKRDLGDARERFVSKPASTVTLNRPLAAMSDAEALAQSVSRDVLSEFIEASGTCIGQPAVRAGARVRLSGIGRRMSGTYLVTSATHTYRQDEEYLTEFTISSRVSDSIAALVTDGLAETNAGGLVQGMTIGVVTNLNDPRNLGRVKVKFPWMGDSPGIESAWCRIAAPMAGPGRGWMSLPEINDEVLVAFEHGDVNVPFIVGGLWNQQDPPPRSTTEAAPDSAVNLRVWRSRSGHELLFDDTDGAERVVLCDMTGENRIEILSSENKLSVAVAGDCMIQSKGNLTLDSGASGNMTLQCNAFKLVANGNCDLSSPKFDFNKGALEIT